MIVNLKKIRINYLSFIILLLIFFYSINIFSSENKIIFKINENVFTSLDLEKRLEYLDFVGGNKDIDNNVVLEDFISANLFYEYYKKSANQIIYKKKINEIYDNIYDTNKLNNKIYSFEINKENILNNIKIDFIRKIILENILNSSLSNIKTTKEEIDLLYNLKIKYININTNNFMELKNKINNMNLINFDNVLSLLKQNKIEYFKKVDEINDITKINPEIKKNILANNNFFIFEKNSEISIIFIEKSFETFDGLIAEIFSVRSNSELKSDFLKCQNLAQLNRKNNISIVNKEYKFIDLNNELKNSLVNINDYVKYSTDNENVYIILCNIKFDQDILKNNNLNKLINENIYEIEYKFINKYSKIFNLMKFDE